MFLVKCSSNGREHSAGSYKRQAAAESAAQRLVKGGVDSAVVRDALGGLRFSAYRRGDGTIGTQKTPLGHR